MVFVCADLTAGVAVGNPYRLKYYGISGRVRPAKGTVSPGLNQT